MSHFLVSPEDVRNFEALRNLLKDADNSTVAFVGSGMSRPNGYASWETLVGRLAESVGVAFDRYDVDGLLEASERVRQRYGDKFPNTADAHFREAIRQYLLESDHPQLHSSLLCLAQINFSAFLTTNFDPSIDIATGLDSARKCHSIPYRLDTPFDSGYLRAGGIYHIHGRLWDQEMKAVEDPIVFLRSEYEVAYGSSERQGEISKFLDPVFRIYNIVFIGFGMRDPAFMAFMERVRQIEAYRALAKFRRYPDEPIGPKQVPRWFSIVPLPEEDDSALDQCALEHSTNGQFTLIHYKYSVNDDKQYHWGLYELLKELSKSCPYMGQIPADSETVQASTEAFQLEPLTEPSPIVVPSSGSEPAVHSHTQVTEDFNQILDRVEAVLRQDNPSDQDIDWVISQTSEPAILDFATRMLTDHPDLLKGWFPIFFSARLLSAPQFAVLEGEGGIEPYWHTGGILITAASQSHPLLETVLQSFRYVGPNAKLRLLRAFLEIRDVELVASLVPTVRGWLTSGPPVVLDYGVPGLGSHVVSMLQAGYEVQAAELLNAMLEQKN